MSVERLSRENVKTRRPKSVTLLWLTERRTPSSIMCSFRRGKSSLLEISKHATFVIVSDTFLSIAPKSQNYLVLAFLTDNKLPDAAMSYFCPLPSYYDALLSVQSSLNNLFLRLSSYAALHLHSLPHCYAPLSLIISC